MGDQSTLGDLPRSEASTGDRTLQGVGVTALLVAQARAVESERPDRLFDDPYAAGFVERAGPDFLASAAEIAPVLKLRGNGRYFGVRTRFFDDCLLDAVRSGCRQAVLLGAGLDTRAYRLGLPQALELYELDLADVLAWKADALAAGSASPTCERVAVPVDLRGGWAGALLSAGFRVAEPTVWLAEGILMYLTEGERDRLLESIGSLSAPASRLGLEQRGVPTWTDTIPEDGKSAREAVERFGVKTSDDRPDPSMVDPAAWLARRGWRAGATSAAEAFARYGRPVPEVLAAGAVQLWLVSAERESGSGRGDRAV